MTACHRALFTCFVFLIFLILLVLRLDSRAQLNWFIVFLPLGIYCLVILIYIHFNIISHCKNGLDRVGTSMKRKVWYVVAVCLVMASQILLCLKLEYPSWNIPTYYVIMPLWLCLVTLSVDIFMILIQKRRSRLLGS